MEIHYEEWGIHLMQQKVTRHLAVNIPVLQYSSTPALHIPVENDKLLYRVKEIVHKYKNLLNIPVCCWGKFYLPQQAYENLVSGKFFSLLQVIV